MLNQVVLVGRLTKDPEIKEKDGIKVGSLTLAIPRSFKNENGEYDTDFVEVKIFNSIAENTAEYCKKGDIVGIKGRLQSTEDFKLELISEKVTFLSSRKEND